jgi:hypothetical protein
MRLLRLILCAITVAWAGPAMAGDPFEDARYHIGIKNNEAALRVIDSGAFDVNMQTSEGYSLLHYAADANNLPMVDALLQRGADPSLKTQRGSTAIDMATGTMVQARLKAALAASKGAAVKANPPAAGNGGGGDYDAIRYYIGIKNNEAAIAELAKGFDVNMQTDEGYTLLHHAAEQNNLVMVNDLLRRGANPNLRSAKGSTAADMGYYYKPILSAIQARGGKLNLMANAKGPVPMTPNSVTGKADAASPAAKSKYAAMCEDRHYSSSSLCSDSTCKMREYRKWQTCLQTGSYY